MKKLYIFLIICIVAISCKEDQNRNGEVSDDKWIKELTLIIEDTCNYGVDFNDERIEKGIPIVENGWVFSQPIPQLIEWVDKGNIYNNKLPKHVAKDILIGDSTRMNETDIYFCRYNNSIFHFLEFTFSFENKNKQWSSKFRIDSVKTVIRNDKKALITQSNYKTIPIDSAIKKLNEWNIKGLSIPKIEMDQKLITTQK